MQPMTRDIHLLQNNKYDVVIIGAGIFGVCAAWDAALRGLSVAIVDKGDFSHATSANHFKMVHGGIRYLQHADVVRIRESSRERSALLRIAPHLVKPLPIVIPTYGHGMKGKAVLGCGMLIYDLLTLDRNSGLQRDRQIPWGKFISPDQVLNLFPGIRREGLTGAAVFCDGQMYNPPRIALSFMRSATERKVDAANYVSATGFLRDGDRVLGIKAKDMLENRSFEIHGRCVLNAAGPWAHRLLASELDLRLSRQPTFSRDLAFVINRSPSNDYALAFSTGTGDSDTLVDRGGRHLFAVPWRDYTLIGVWHKVYEAPPDDIVVEPEEIESFVNEVNQAYPGIGIRLDEVTLINTGLTLFGEEEHQSTATMSFGKRSMLIDHESTHGLKDLVTLIGVRATTARGMASKAVDLIMRKTGLPGKKADTAGTTIYGGDIDSFDRAVESIVLKHRADINDRRARCLVANYGSQWPAVLKYANEDSLLFEPLGESSTLAAEVIHAVREEMAVHLSDVVFRRTDFGTGRIPTKPELETCARLMADELGWDRQAIENEIDAVEKAFHTIGAPCN
jgi:glycerol-3-phosphate dehydrogenase